MLKIIQNRKVFYILSAIIIAASIVVVAFMGLRLGIDFTGGSMLEVGYTESRPSPEEINEAIADIELETLQVQAVGELGYLLRMPDITDQQRRDIISRLKDQIGDTGAGLETLHTGLDSLGGLVDEVQLGFADDEDGGQAVASNNHLVEKRFEAIGPVIGAELKSKSIQAIFVVLLAILLYIAYAFRKVSWPVQSWKYGIVALITLFHDVTIVLGVFTVLTHIFGWELNTAFVAAILTILGYSVNDTIVVFDRIRENLPRMSGAFEDIVNKSVNQTISRSINTSLTTLAVLVAIAVFGGASIRSFVIALSMGVLVGTYSSIFIASPLLVTAQLFGAKSKKQ